MLIVNLRFVVGITERVHQFCVLWSSSLSSKIDSIISPGASPGFFKGGGGGHTVSK